MKKNNRRTKEERIQLISDLRRLDISETILYNWKTGRTKIPSVYLINERDFLKKYLPSSVLKLYRI